MLIMEIIAYTALALNSIFTILVCVLWLKRRNLYKKGVLPDENVICNVFEYSFAPLFALPVLECLMALFIFNPSGVVINTYFERLLYSTVLFFILSSMSIYATLITLVWKIEISDDCFIHTNLFGVKRTYKYDEVETKELSGVYRVYKKGRWLFSVSYMSENCYRLLEKRNTYLNKQKKCKTKTKI